MTDKYVRIFCDYSADPFWHKGGGMMGYGSLPISDALKLAFAAWNQHFQLNDTYLAYWNDKYNEKEFLNNFCRMGEVLAKQVKAELPDWTVVYLNKAKHKAYIDAQEFNPSPYDRSTWEYEITETNSDIAYQLNKGV